MILARLKKGFESLTLHQFQNIQSTATLEVALASHVPLTALITGALAQALRMFCMRQRALLPRVALIFEKAIESAGVKRT
jgi:hypothetical protein